MHLAAARQAPAVPRVCSEVIEALPAMRRDPALRGLVTLEKVTQQFQKIHSAIASVMPEVLRFLTMKQFARFKEVVYTDNCDERM
jgi:hypothetical protein